MSSQHHQIETARLLLRPFAAEDAAVVAALGREPVKAAFLPDWQHTEESAAGLIGWFAQCWESPDPRVRPAVWAITMKESGEVVGHVGLGPKEELGGEVEIGYAVSQRFAGQGFATEAAQATVSWAFHQGGLDSLAALVLPDNGASASVLEKIGFAPCGTLDAEHCGSIRRFGLFRLARETWQGAEPMAGFFDRRAGGYEDHMRQNPEHDSFYDLAVSAIPETLDPIAVLDLGCGTGMELAGLFRRAPNAHVTCIDLSAGMLAILRENYRNRISQITVVQASYVDWQYPEAAYDYALSVNTMHHFLEPRKVGIYRGILRALVPGGAYIEADYMVDEATMAQCLHNYQQAMARMGEGQDGDYHLDIPFTPVVQRRLLQEAGFASVHTVLDRVEHEWKGAILLARK